MGAGRATHAWQRGCPGACARSDNVADWTFGDRQWFLWHLSGRPVLTRGFEKFTGRPRASKGTTLRHCRAAAKPRRDRVVRSATDGHPVHPEP